MRHRDDGVSVGRAERLTDYFAGLYNLDHPALRPGTLVGIHENLRQPDHGGPHLVEAQATLDPDAACVYDDDATGDPTAAREESEV